MAKYDDVSRLGGFRTIDFFNDDIVEGNVYGAFVSDSGYESDETFGIFWETLDNNLTLNLGGQIICGTDSQLIVYEGLTINPGAIPVAEFTAINVNRLYPSATANIKSIAASPTVGSVSTTTTSDTSPIAAPGTIIAFVPFGGDRTKFNTISVSNLILAPNTVYGIEFTPGGAGGTAELAAIQLIWSEISISTDDELESLSFFEDVRQRILRVRNIVI